MIESLTVGLSCLCLCLMTLKCLLNQCVEIEVIRTKDERKTEQNKQTEKNEQKENTDNNIVTKPDINQLSEF